MATIAMKEGPARIIYPSHNGIVVQEKFSDKCDRCGHSRADHLVPGAVTLDAVTDCNRCGKYAADYGEAKPADVGGSVGALDSEKLKLANTPLCPRFA